MRTTILHKWVLAAFALITLSSLAQAQTMGGGDVKVFDYKNNPAIKTKMSVADNGWIYLMAHGKHESGETEVRVFRSKDDGVTFQELTHWTRSSYWFFQDFDIIVTGKDESDIRFWSVELLNDPAGNRSVLSVFKRNANLEDGNAVRMYEKEFTNTQLYDVSIASNYRSPAPDLMGGNPFALAVAYTGFNSAENKSFVGYLISMEAGRKFKLHHPIFSQDGKEKIGKVDLSLGSTSSSMAHNNWPIMGVVFEMNRVGNSKSDIGFLSNFVDYDSDFRWAAPIKVNTFGEARGPKIQMMLDSEKDNTLAGETCHNFMIMYNHYDSDERDWQIRYVYPKPNFRYKEGVTPTMDDLEEAPFATTSSDEFIGDLSYDKSYGHYLVTYADIFEYEDSVVWKLKYCWVPYDLLNDLKKWSVRYVYKDDFNTPVTPPQVDIHPIKRKACWAWGEYHTDKSVIRADTEWSTITSVEEILPQGEGVKLCTSSADGYMMLKLPMDATWKAFVYDMQGRKVAEVSFEGEAYKLNVQHLPKGTYLLKVASDTGRFVEKFIVE